jgi:hypothetical protein
MSSEPMAVEAPSLTSAPADQAHVPHQPVDSSSNSAGNPNGRKRPASPTGKESAVSNIDGAVEKRDELESWSVLES